VEWYYIGHYGQLGPLSKEQMEELIEGSVILADTYVWKSGMGQWQTADTVHELRAALQAAAPFAAPPPPPMAPEPQRPQPPAARTSFAPQPKPYTQPQPQPNYPANPNYYRTDMAYAARSDKSRVLAGVLQLFLPGVGRIYLGYYAYGTLQLVLFLCTFGLMALWSVVDGIMILAGTVKFDGFGRVLLE